MDESLKSFIVNGVLFWRCRSGENIPFNNAAIWKGIETTSEIAKTSK